MYVVHINWHGLRKGAVFACANRREAEDMRNATHANPGASARVEFLVGPTTPTRG